jgi:hypothetical protein
MCSYQNGRHVCQMTRCAVGRPFLVDGGERLATSETRADWAAGCVVPRSEDLSSSTRERLAGRWTQIGLMEHASIAAFARFTLHLLAVGAPSGLVRAAQEAMGDETNHAQLAFALAGAYGRADVGPGALAIDGSLDGFSVSHLVATLLREGCIGETVAAIEAREGLEHARDPGVRAVLAILARDELRHAELAWRTVAWLIAAGRVSRAAVLDEAERALAEAFSAPAPDDSAEGLLVHGIVSDIRRDELRREALMTVVAPCVRALVRRTVFSPADAREYHS